VRKCLSKGFDHFTTHFHWLAEPEQSLWEAIKREEDKTAILVCTVDSALTEIKMEEAQEEKVEVEGPLTRMNRGPFSYHIVLYRHLTKFDNQPLPC
jgi:hypothetical protein